MADRILQGISYQLSRQLKLSMGLVFCTYIHNNISTFALNIWTRRTCGIALVLFLFVCFYSISVVTGELPTEELPSTPENSPPNQLPPGELPSRELPAGEFPPSDIRVRVKGRVRVGSFQGEFAK